MLAVNTLFVVKKNDSKKFFSSKIEAKKICSAQEEPTYTLQQQMINAIIEIIGGIKKQVLFFKQKKTKN